MPQRKDAIRIGLSRLLALVAISSSLSTTAQEAPSGPVGGALESLLTEGQHPYLTSIDLAAERVTLENLYAAGGGQFLWSRDHAVTPSALAVMSELRSAENVGLRATDYDANRLSYAAMELAAAKPPGDDQWALFDIAVSGALLAYVHDLHLGRIDPHAAGLNLDVEHSRLDAVPLMQQISHGPDVAGILHGIEPPFLHYELLKKALLHYRELALEPELTQLPPLPDKSVKPGQPYAGAAQLRHLLAALGDMPSAASPAASDAVLSDDLVEALKRFQELSGLDPDGALGAGTFAALTTPLTNRVQQIELTLERWRWLPPKIDTPPILVNIPRYRLYAFRTVDDREGEMLQMGVIVGKSYPANRTPVFTADMKYLVMRPYWDVPYSITTREMLPKIRDNPGYLHAQRLEIVGGYGDDTPALPPTPDNLAALARGTLRLRQQPGPDNALGLVKFMLPNPYNVYLHSTPAQSLFERSARAFSHGCVRVSDPVALAEYVLRDDPSWTRERILQAMNGTRPTQVNLKQPIRVYILYGTAVATEQGQVYFLPDIYGHDARLAELLRASRKTTVAN
ncbi:MAG TPA: L,D-transpeptidase family protein [Steroidobacteraceae bacterium]|jgi:murein L,D-transpeptidase YcbB/YkuD|nr:L,D-transpeptidase family protein [Steroidobacteraceae bacterium]